MTNFHDITIEQWNAQSLASSWPTRRRRQNPNPGRGQKPERKRREEQELELELELENETKEIAEYGSILVNHQWQEVELSLNYTNPIVITSDPTFKGGDPAVVRLQNIDSDSFQIRLQEPNYKDGWHVNETISYVVMEEGTWELSDGTTIEAGVLNTNKLSTQGRETVALDDAFGSDASVAVLTQTQTFNGGDWVTTRTDNITGESFEVMMQEEEKLNRGGHVTESIGFLAIEQGTANNGETIIEGGVTADKFTHQAKSHSFAAEFDSAPTLLTKLDSFDGPDTANSRIRSVDDAGFTAMVIEEQSRDSEMGHTTESLSYLALSGTSGTLLTSTNNNNNGSAEFTITGDPTIGNVLKIDLVNSDPNGDGNFSYSWLSSIDNFNWSNISINESLLVSKELEGNRIRGYVSYKDGEGFPEAVYTDSVTVSYQNDGNAQFNISGLPQTGQTLTVGLIENDPDGNGAFNYSWRSSIDAENWTEIMTGESLDVSNDLEGYIIQNRITYIDQQGFSETSFTNSVTIANSDVDDYSGDVNTTGRLVIGETTLGELEEAGDHDWFRVSLLEGNTYKFDHIGDSLSDPYLYLRDDAGIILTSDDDGGSWLNSQITFTAESSGPYYLDAGAYGYAIGTYSISGQRVPDVNTGFSSTDGWGEVSASRAFETLLDINLPSVEDLGGNYWGLDNLNVPEVWASSPGFGGATGIGTTIAVIDTGVDLDHPEFIGRIVEGYDFVDNDSNADDGHGHGTHVAGTIAGNDDDGFGISGVAPDALIMPIRVLDDDGYGYTSDIIEGLLWATNNNADVANLSLGGGGYSQAMADAIEYASNNQTVVVMAAGNSGGSSPDYPAAHALNYGLAVGAVDQYRNMASFSNRAGNTVMDYVTAPGEYIYSSVPGGYDIYSGTSMATPHVAGVAALLKSYDNTLTAEAIEDLLTETASNAVTTSASQVSTVNSTVDNTISLESINKFNDNDFPDKLIGHLKSNESEGSAGFSRLLVSHTQRLTNQVFEFIGSNDSEFVSIDLSGIRNPRKKTNYVQALLRTDQFEYFEIDSIVTSPDVTNFNKIINPTNDSIETKILQNQDIATQDIRNNQASDPLTNQDQAMTTIYSIQKDIYEIDTKQTLKPAPSHIIENANSINTFAGIDSMSSLQPDNHFKSFEADFLKMQLETL